MLEINLGAETEARLADYATHSGKKIDDLVAEAVQHFWDHDPDSCPPECEGEPNEESLEAMAAMARGECDSMTFEEFIAWMKQVRTELDQEELQGRYHAAG
ncbi:MAG: hypothetical protein QM537_09460 [Candidatus Symbiobacter sp.]|nr:hypothetical protein [Candidatus Symbiobacter sp.]